MGGQAGIQSLESALKLKTDMSTPEKDIVTIEKIFDVPIMNMWNAWTDPSVVIKWFGSEPGGEVLEAKLDVKPGGRFKITFRNPDQTEHTCSGVYAEVVEFSKLSFSWEWKSEPGVVSFVTMLLTP